MIVSHASGSNGCAVWRAMVSDSCLSLYWDHMPGGGMEGVGPPPAPRVSDLGGLLLELFAGDYCRFGPSSHGILARTFTSNVLVCIARLRAHLDVRQPMPVSASPGGKEDSLCARAFWGRSLPWWQALIRSPHLFRVHCASLLSTIWYHHED